MEIANKTADQSAPERLSPGFTPADVMTAAEVADVLQLQVSTVYYLARRGELPGQRLGRAWRFPRWRLEEYLNG